MRLFIISLMNLFVVTVYSQDRPEQINCKEISDRVVVRQVLFDANNISTWVINTGIFNQDLRMSNTPGFQWPKGSGKFAIFTTGLCIGAYFNNQLREAVASWKGEYAPGYIVDTLGSPCAKTNCSFKIYKVNHDDHNSADWQNWGNMVPFGAPFVDVNHNGTYEPAVDTPGMSGAAQTIFLCLTDGFPGEHKLGEGFGGGTLPLYAELHLTAWAYTTSGLEDVQFFKWVVINRSDSVWNKTYFAIFSDCDIGSPDDDYNGCDTLLQLGYTYNGEDMDGTGQGISYGLHPPAAGIQLLRSPINSRIYHSKQLGMTSYGFVKGTCQWGAACEKDANGEPLGAYNFMKGFKKDGTPWVVPPGGFDRITKYCFSGDPESGNKWNEGLPGNPSGSVLNCGGPNGVTGPIYNIDYFGERRFILGSGSDNLKVLSGDTQTIVIAQMVARGTNNLNSVTKLKQLAANVKVFYEDNFTEPPIPVTFPNQFKLYQNYPNPFNPSTKIKFEIAPLLRGVPEGRGVSVVLTIYDILGREVETLVNEQLKPGTYEVTWDASQYASGVYFYKLMAGDFIETKKIVLIK